MVGAYVEASGSSVMLRMVMRRIASTSIAKRNRYPPFDLMGPLAGGELRLRARFWPAGFAFLRVGRVCFCDGDVPSPWT